MEEQQRKTVALITGGSRGIGRAICLRLAAMGCYVIINYKSNRAEAEKTQALVQAGGGSAKICQFDVSEREAVWTAIDLLIEEFEGIDILVNNAGITADQLLVMMSPEKWDSVINTSLNGFYHTTKPVLQSMLVRKKGSIVSIASVSAITGNKGQSNYSAAKAGIIAASKSLAMEVAKRNIRINVVAPGLIDTEMITSAPVDSLKSGIPMGRIGTPDEVAAVVSFLCSDDASYITGQVISVNGGMT